MINDNFGHEVGDYIIQQIIKRFNNMVNVIRVTDLSDANRVEREMVLIKLKTTEKSRAEILRIVDIFRAKVVDTSLKSYTIEITGDIDKVEGFIQLLKPFGIKEIARTGTVAMTRENKKTK